ncbi:DUF4870 family protein [Thiohalophilus thiocyanatoxydans]|uniref:Putative membrane protein n=1 Tax=Thiohalophilus thiocyanatoxydans TaxID=381308 RepID=A0A4R8IPC3_9GAMM|nr:hypothetical protein [Thiohalophilus thiocyanatoxydans]TDY02772.1 putative membrane protein [Thiohalophilus thiocyanatoxydans]
MEPTYDPYQDPLDNLVKLTHIVYLLQALAYVTAITYVIAVIVNYVKLDDVRGTWLESHFRWQIRTFWYGLLGLIVGAITYFIVIGWLILLATFFWVVYRIVKGWLYLYEKRPMTPPTIPPQAST